MTSRIFSEKKINIVVVVIHNIQTFFDEFRKTHFMRQSQWQFKLRSRGPVLSAIDKSCLRGTVYKITGKCALRGNELKNGMLEIVRKKEFKLLFAFKKKEFDKSMQEKRNNWESDREKCEKRKNEWVTERLWKSVRMRKHQMGKQRMSKRVQESVQLKWLEWKQTKKLWRTFVIWLTLIHSNW